MKIINWKNLINSWTATFIVLIIPIMFFKLSVLPFIIITIVAHELGHVVGAKMIGAKIIDSEGLNPNGTVMSENENGNIFFLAFMGPVMGLIPSLIALIIGGPLLASFAFLSTAVNSSQIIPLPKTDGSVMLENLRGNWLKWLLLISAVAIFGAVIIAALHTCGSYHALRQNLLR